MFRVRVERGISPAFFMWRLRTPHDGGATRSSPMQGIEFCQTVRPPFTLKSFGINHSYRTDTKGNQMFPLPFLQKILG